ncbi:ATP-binding cassette domain-containing protein [Streptomyces sp. NPDC006307]|uniref:ATP-binding cassette domain-containing protein n=1 Tax=Streptomyces sp. NPDC006307 TaxID=3156748 RepID=UPI00339E07E7
MIELAHLSGLVARLPHGLDTEAGEHGTALSGGERQRMALARALLTRPGCCCSTSRRRTWTR